MPFSPRTILKALVCVPALLVLVPTARAGTLLTHFRFVRIDRVSQINPEGKYILLAAYDGKGYLLKAQPTEDKKKIASYIIPLTSDGATTAPDTLAIPPTDCIWQFRPANDSLWSLVSFDGHKTITSNSSGASDLSLTTDLRSDNILYWNISKQDGLFKLTNAKRRLSLNEGYDYFGYYTMTAGMRDLCIYRAVCDTFEIDSAAAAPDAPFAYTASSSPNVKALLWKSREAQAQTDVTDYVLHDHTLATDAPATKFAIKDNRLTADGSTVVKDSTEGRWTQCAGIPLLVHSGQPQALCCDARQANRFLFLPTDSVDGLIYRYLLPMSYAAAAASSLDNHTLTLSGGWSKPAIGRLQLRAGITGLDLTACSLPTTVPEISVTEANRVIYVTESDTSLLSDTQANVVVCTADGNTLTTPLELIDRRPFHFDRDVSVPRDGQICYRRLMPDNGWQTLYLPFDIEDGMPDMAFATIESIEREAIKVAPATAVKAYTPLLFRYRGKSDTTVTFSGCAQTIKATPQNAAAPFQGLADTLSITPGTTGLALNASGTAFVPMLTGSTLAPFRAYLNSSSLSPKYIATATDGIRSATHSTRNCPAYDLEGRPLPRSTRSHKPVLIIKDRHVFNPIQP